MKYYFYLKSHIDWPDLEETVEAKTKAEAVEIVHKEHPDFSRETIEENLMLENGDNMSEFRWCKTHSPKKIGKDQFGNFYDQCFTGHTTGEKCDIVVEMIDDNSSTISRQEKGEE